MKKLRLFAPFNAELFFSNIDLQFVKLEEVYTDGIKSGFKYHLLIIADNNKYGDDSSLNMGELIKVKVDNNKCNIDFTLGAIVELVSPRASIYGDYQNQLSIKADNVVLKKSK